MPAVSAAAAADPAPDQTNPPDVASPKIEHRPVEMPRWDRHVLLCVLVAAAVLIPRSWLILRTHSEIIDADYHLRHGLAVLLGHREQFEMSSTDAPLGQVILALPLAATGNIPSKPIHLENWPRGLSTPGERQPADPPASPQRAEFERMTRRGILYGNRWSPTALLQLIAVWKALLFVPVMAVIFQWCRAIYGLRSAWLTTAMVLFEPNFAAHIPVVALDSLAAGSIVLACFFMWRYFERETLGRLACAVTFGVAAMLIKHTAVIVPGVFLLFAIYYWIWRPWRGGVTWPQWRTTLGPRATTLVRAVLIGLVAMWVLLGFDYSVPARQFNDVTLSPTSRIGEIVDGSLQLRWPCGTYIGCFVSGLLVNDFGQPALIYGHISDRGWPWYFPVLMTLKTPLGIWLVMLLALASLWRVRLRPGEISIIIPLLAWVAFFTLARVNYGFRHFLPAYAFMLMWAGRCVADGIAATMRRRLMVIACCAVAIAAVDSVWWHPNYLSYVNFPRDRVWMQMTDSNIDWGQSMRQIARWLDAHPPPGGKTVHVVTRTTWAGYDGRYWLGDRVHFIERGQTPPSDGILIISPIWVCGVYDAPDYKPYAFLRGATPVDMIGESTLVYDLDQIRR